MLRPKTMMILAALVAGTTAGCAGDKLDADSQSFRQDAAIEGPVPWFREAGCGPGHSGASGQPCPCGPSGSGASGQPCDGGPPRDTSPPDTAPPKPDVCVPPAQWSCDVTLSFAKVGSETTGGVHGDFNGPSPTPWITKPMTLQSGQWTLTLPLNNGSVLNYKFVVDLALPGETWFHDAANPNKIPDGFGGFNSQLNVSCPDPCSR